VLNGPVFRYARVEGWRLLTAPASILVLVLFAILEVYSVVAWTGLCASPRFASAFGGFSCTTGVSVSFALPLVAVLVGGTAAASERFRGADVLLAVRGLAGPAYVSARMLAGAMAAGVGVGVTGLAAIVTGLVVHPWRRPRLIDPSVSFINGPPEAPGTPSSWLWAQAPLANDFLVLAIVMVAAAAVAALGTAMGMWVRSPIVVVTIVAGGLLVGHFVVPFAVSDFLNPEDVLDFGPDSQVPRQVSSALRPLAHLGLWLGLLVVSWPVAVKGARRAMR